MEVVRPEFEPDPSLSRERMENLQREIASAALFEDDFAFDPGLVTCTPDEPVAGERPIVAGVDQAFVEERAVSAVVVLRGDEVIERVHAVADLAVPYIPGLLSFREGGSILAALQKLESDPDVLFFDGSGRIHFREAGLATHIGLMVDCPSVGVAKNLLCGTPQRSVEGGLPEGERVPIAADGVETTPAGTTIGYAVQTKQYESSQRHVNPVYVSPGHRTSAETAADLALACAGGYKLPDPTRLADEYADEAKTSLE